MSGTGANLPIRIQVEGGQAAEAAFNSVAATGERAMQRVGTSSQDAAARTGNLTQVVGSAGYQLQDFAVQVQGGTSALTALSQQGSQFLGVFGPAGAVAGAVLTVGILAASFIDLGEKIETTAEAERKLREAIEASNEIFETAIEKANRLAQARIRAASLGVEERLTADRERLRALNAQQTDVEDRRAFARDRIGGNSTDNNPLIRAERERVAQQAEIISQRIAEAEAELIRLRAITAGGEQYGPNQPTTPPRESGGRAPRPERDPMDVQAAVARSVQEATAAYDAFNASINLNEANLSGASGALSAYERNIQTLENALAAGVITEQQFAADVETATLALGRQIEAVERRGQQANGIGRELGFAFSSAFEDAIIKGKEFSQVLQGLAQDLAKLVLRQTVTQPLANALGNAISGLNFFGGGAGTGATVSGGPKGGRASGGPVFAGNSYLVGERGPEIITMGAAGTVIPNAGGTFAPVYNIDARGADPSMLPQLDARMRAIAAQSLAQFSDSIQRGGQAARLVGRR